MSQFSVNVYPPPTITVDVAAMSTLSLDVVAGPIVTGGGGGATNLDGLTDVVVSTPALGQLLRFDGTNWVNWAHDFALASATQPLDADLTAIAALSTTAFGRSLLTGVDAPAIRTVLGLDIAAPGGLITAITGGQLYLYQPDTYTWSLSTSGFGFPRLTFKTEGPQAPSDGYFGFSQGTNGNGTVDLYLRRDASNTLAQRNGTASQVSRIYGTFTDSSNYERGYLQADSNGFNIGHEALGTGVKRPTRILGPSLTGTETVSAFHVLQTWNTTGLPTAILVNITDTASNAHSVICAMNVNSVPMFRFFKGGVFGPAGLVLSGTSANYGAADYNWWSANGLNLGTNAYLSINDDTYIRRDAADTLAQRRGANPQTLRVYNTFTDSSNYERAKLAWESNQFVIGSDHLGTGSARSVAIVGGQTGTQGVCKVSTGGVLVGAQLNLSNSSNATASTSQIVLYTPAAGQLRITNATSDGFDRLLLGPATASFPMLKRNGTAINFRVGDDTADAPITVANEAYSASWSGSNQVPTKDALYNKIETLGGGGGGGVSSAFAIAMAVAL